MKKIIIPIVIFIVLVVGVVGFVFFNREKAIMIDINPSFEIKVGFGNKVKKIIPINEDAKGLFDENKVNGKNINIALKKITKVIVDRGFIPEGETSILVYSKGINSESIGKDLKNYFRENEVEVEVIIIKKITAEDKKLAKEYNISPSKAAYINSIRKSNVKVEVKDLINSSVEDLNFVEEKGLYCDEGYTLERHNCVKEIRRENAIASSVCPSGTLEYNGFCYEEKGSKRGTKDICHDDFKLVDGNCVREDIVESVPDCGKNEYNSDQDKCTELVYVEDGIEFCRDPGRTLYEHKCLATKPTINGGCLGSDALIGGNCVNLIDDYYLSEWKCSNGEVLSGSDGNLKYGDTKCYEKTYVDVIKRDCPQDYKLQGTKCYLKQTEKPQKERICESGTTMVDGRCINMNKIYDKVDGYICSDDTARLEGNVCIIYEVVGAKENK
ncbi:MAG: hypothetical protein IKP79_00500 [Bacilli bacterium]|nr:hypothetical protein [Bacilli bacterium]